MKVLVLGVSGMLGSTIYKYFSSNKNLQVVGSARGSSALKYFAPSIQDNIVVGVDAENHDSIVEIFAQEKPEIVINCIGLVKQLSSVNNPLNAVPINTMLPHRLVAMCKVAGARLIHFSTDCVFSGSKGGYTEEDLPDAYDVYGRSKLMGEVDYPHAITLRTSIIGHELQGNRSLINWFLSQDNEVNGFKNVIYSGLPTIEIAKIIEKYILHNPKLHGVYHVASNPINKFDLLNIVKEVYQKDISILPVEEPRMDRSLNATIFEQETGYTPPTWKELVKLMYEFK